MEGPKKLCLSCMRKIPLFAGRCPYCIDDNQGVHGRFILLLAILIGLIVFAHWYTNKHEGQIIHKRTDQELKQELESMGFSNE